MMALPAISYTGRGTDSKFRRVEAVLVMNEGVVVVAETEVLLDLATVQAGFTG